MFCAASLWGLLKLRNNLCFQKVLWKDMRTLLRKIVVMLHGWSLLCPIERRLEFSAKLKVLNSIATSPARIAS
jgi:hypothetical protein